VLRQGHRLTDADAIALLRAARERIDSLAPLSDEEARAALRAPRQQTEQT
jgi:hypothetical protein